jgi:hypothetical protein
MNAQQGEVNRIGPFIRVWWRLYRAPGLTRSESVGCTYKLNDPIVGGYLHSAYLTKHFHPIGPGWSALWLQSALRPKYAGILWASTKNGVRIPRALGLVRLDFCRNTSWHALIPLNVPLRCAWLVYLFCREPFGCMGRELKDHKATTGAAGGAKGEWKAP